VKLQALSDEEIVEIAKPILMDTIIGGNNKDWVQFSKNTPPEVIADPEEKADMEKQWAEDAYLSAFSENPEFLAVIRKTDCVLVLWRLTSAVTDEEYLEKLYLEEIDGKVYQAGIWTE